MTQDLVVEHFDRLSATGMWSGLYGKIDGMNYHMHIRRRRVMELLPKKLGRVLDVGCGPGVFVDQLLERGAIYEGIDISREMITEASCRYGNRTAVKFRLGTVESIDLAPDSYDHVIAVGLLEYLSEVETTLTRIAELLCHGGTAVLTIPKRWHIDRVTIGITAPLRAAARVFARGLSDGVPRLLLQPGELDRAASRAGLRRVSGAQYHFTPLAYPLHRFAPDLCMKINLPFNRWHQARDPFRSFLAHGYIGCYVKP